MQALLHGGELAPVRPRVYIPDALRSSQLPVILGGITLLVLLLSGAGWLTALGLPVLIGWILEERWNARLIVKVLRRLRIELEVQLRSVTVPISGWPFEGPDHVLCLVMVEIEVDSDPAQLERAVRLGEPRATLTFVTDRILRVEFGWDSDPLGLERLDRLLFDILLTHADELGIRHIRFRTPHERAIADQPTRK